MPADVRTVRRIVIAGIMLLHGDSVKRRNLGMNQEAAQRTRMKQIAAMSVPIAIGSASRDFLRSFKAGLIMHPSGHASPAGRVEA
jgi:hypothetical protein